ncbi:Glu-tRNA(Gln) amidotransferase subunit GatD [Candidatus Woesearchaeota archaeon]|nr:Glu-tRNA(Gln) amidotransferase subunit GatD [Candidatus Woesearchaeota archaeon]
MVKQSYSAGDIVKVTTTDEVVEGMILPRPDILEGDFLVLKLSSGYNIGIDEKKIKKVEVTKKYSAPNQKKKKLSYKKGLSNVSVISAGGTISSKVDYRTGGTVADYTAEDFVEMMPELENLANIKAIKSLNIMSEDMNNTHWEKIAKDIQKELNSDADGVVLSQGTDTLQYSAAALSFFFHDVKKPIIITASQRSIDRGSSDAYQNLVCAINAAANLNGAGVYVCMHANSSDDYCYLIKASKVRKMHTSRRDAFRPINTSASAEVYMDKKIKVVKSDFNKRDNKSKTKLHLFFEEKIGFIQANPLIDSKLIDFFVENKYKGLVISGTGLGHIPLEGKNSVRKSLENARKKGLVVVIASQCLYGRVNPYVYSNARELLFNFDLIYAEDMLPETAFVKLGWVLGQTKDYNKVKELMLTSIAGEINKNLDDESFLY